MSFLMVSLMRRHTWIFLCGILKRGVMLYASWPYTSLIYLGGELQHDFVICLIALFSVYYYLLSLSHDCTSLNQVWIDSSFVACIIQLVVFELDHDALSELLESMKQESSALLVQVKWKRKSQSILKNMKN